MELIHIQVSFLTVSSKQKNKNEHEIPWYLHTIQNLRLVKTREFDFSLVWIMEFSNISLCLGKGKDFSDNCSLINLVDVQSLYENGK